ncbi:hypothetical protein ACJRO7_008300 [Eucalyptus globulus]|uniref:Uncharacterized protein n=1 Tax=Eucalyptus globulus TaxID=34317 RepID=A0ABD3IQR1_EUCGL
MHRPRKKMTLKEKLKSARQQRALLSFATLRKTTERGGGRDYRHERQAVRGVGGDWASGERCPPGEQAASSSSVKGKRCPAAELRGKRGLTASRKERAGRAGGD